jgi:hypothetical protein
MAFSRCFYPKQLTVMPAYIFLIRVVLGIKHTILALETPCSTNCPTEDHCMFRAVDVSYQCVCVSLTEKAIGRE